MKFFAVFATVLALAAAAPTTQWSLNELSEAIQNPATPAEYLPYLEHALNNMMEMLFAGQPVDSIVVPTPVGLLPVEIASPAAVMPVEVVDTPIAPGVVAEPIVPAAVNDASGNPLVQITININQESPAAVEVPVAVPEAPVEIQPTPVVIVPEVPETVEVSPIEIVPAPSPIEIVPAPQPIEIVPAPIEVVPAPSPIEIVPAPTPIEIVPAPSPIEIVPAPTPIEIVPAPIEVVPAPSPIEIAPAPENPIDVIAVGAPEVNPADLLAPVPVVVAGDAEGDRV